MRLQIWAIGRNHESYVREGVEDFSRRISRYHPLEWNIIPVPKNTGMLSEADLKRSEAKTVLDWLERDDYLVCLDGKGKEMSSEELADFMAQRANDSVKRLVFLIGGAYGLDEELLRRAKKVWSLSRLTFPHQLVRLILAEQLYRAFTINRNEKYHHR